MTIQEVSEGSFFMEKHSLTLFGQPLDDKSLRVKRFQKSNLSRRCRNSRVTPTSSGSAQLGSAQLAQLSSAQLSCAQLNSAQLSSDQLNSA